MDNVRFDQITRTFATALRRRMLGALAAGALTTLLPRRAGAACQEGTTREGPCGTEECIGGEFVGSYEGSDVECRAGGDECNPPEFCTGTSINCPPDRKRPNGSSCTGDDNPCTDGVCQNGACVAVPNTATCADDGNVCTADICANGTCTHPPLADGTSCPAGGCCGGKCVNTQTDESHCGACGVACGAGRTCCKGKCVKLATDERNCGRCGKRCPRGQTCQRGRCR